MPGNLDHDSLIAVVRETTSMPMELKESPAELIVSGSRVSGLQGNASGFIRPVSSTGAFSPGMSYSFPL